MDSMPDARPQLRKKSTLASLRNGEKKDEKKEEVAPPAPTSHSGHTTVKGTPPTKDSGEPTKPIIDPATAKAVENASKPLGSMKESETPANLEAGSVHNAAADGLAGDTTAKASPSQVDEGPAKKTTPPVSHLTKLLLPRRLSTSRFLTTLTLPFLAPRFCRYLVHFASPASVGRGFQLGILAIHSQGHQCIC